MTEKEYRSHPAISRSELWKLRESPEKFQFYKTHPIKPTPALIFGQAVHKLLLLPDGFYDEFAVAPLVDKRTKVGKDAWEAFQRNVKDREVISHDEFSQAHDMVQRLSSHGLAAQMLAGQHEVEHFWVDEDTGEECKIRTDVEVEIAGEMWLVDYKTTIDASTDGFQREAIKHGYDFQAAMYSEGYTKATGRPCHFAFVAQEKVEPYAINIFVADEDFILRGHDTFRELLGLYHYCKTSDNWFGYLGRDSELNMLMLPPYLRKKEENDGKQ